MDVRAALQELCDEIKWILKYRIVHYGVNHRAHGENTLQGSNLEKSIEIKPIENGVSLKIADYWEYVARGWKRTHKSNQRGLYHELVLWALRKHIKIANMTENESAVRVANAVWFQMIVNRREIAARPFMVYNEEGYLDEMIPELKKEHIIDKWFDKLFEAIISDLDNYFNN